MRKIHWSSDCARTIEEQKKIYSGVLKSITDEVEFLRDYKKKLEKQVDEQIEQIKQLQQNMITIEKEYTELKTKQQTRDALETIVTMPEINTMPVSKKIEPKRSEAKRRAKDNTRPVQAP